MTNVKTRGTWGELQLGAIIDNVLTPGQYEKNVKTPSPAATSWWNLPSACRAAARSSRCGCRSTQSTPALPAPGGRARPGRQGGVAAAGNAFEASIKLEAKKIFQHVAPPLHHRLRRALPAHRGPVCRVMRRPGLVEAVQNDCRVMITGPANLAAMLSRQMGFKTLAIESARPRSGAYWGR